MGKLREMMKTADHTRVANRGQYFKHTATNLGEINVVKFFTTQKSGTDSVVLEWTLVETDNPEAKEKIGEQFTWFGDLERKFQKGVYPDRDRLQQLMVAVCGGGDVLSIPADDGEVELTIEEVYDAVEEDENALDGIQVMIRTYINDEGFCGYTFAPVK